MEDLQKRIRDLTAKTTPISEPGRAIEEAVENVRRALNEALVNGAEYLDYARNEIYALEILFSPTYKGNTNYATSNAIAKGVGRRARAILDDIESFQVNRSRGTRKSRTRKNRTRKNRKSRK